MSIYGTTKTWTFDDDAFGRLGVARREREADAVLRAHGQVGGERDQQVTQTGHAGAGFSRVIEPRAKSCSVSYGRRSVCTSSSRRLRR